MDNCIFCNIVNNKIPSMKVYEDTHTLAIMDLAKDVDGHILVIPKKHITNIFDCDQKTLQYVMHTVKVVSEHLTNNCGYDGVNFLNASGTAAGQSVPHFHIHIIPRKLGDKIDAWPRLPGAKLPVEDVFGKITQK